MGGRKLLRTALRGGGTEEMVKDLKEGEGFGWLRGAVRADISGKGAWCVPKHGGTKYSRSHY